MNRPQKLRIFLCHASEDKPAIRTLYFRLVDDGYDAWLDELNLLPGQDWRYEIPKAVRSSDAIIVCLSNNSISKEGYVQKELTFALDIAEEKPQGTVFIIPTKLEACDVPERLTRWHWVNLFEDNGYQSLKKALIARAQNIQDNALNKHPKDFQDKTKDQHTNQHSQRIKIALNNISKLVQQQIISVESRLDPNDSKVRLERLAKFAATMFGLDRSVRSLAFSPTKQILAAGVFDGSIQLWRAIDGGLIRIIDTSNIWFDAIKKIVFSPGGQTLASIGSNNKISLWRVNDGTLLDTLQGHDESVNSIMFSPDGRFLVSGSDDQTIRLWLISSGSPNKIIMNETGKLETVVFSPNGQDLASVSDDGIIRIWKIENGKLILSIDNKVKANKAIAFSPDGKILAASLSDNTIRFWDSDHGTTLKTLKGHTDNINSLAFSPDGRILASGSGTWTNTTGIALCLWNVNDGTLLRTLKSHLNSVEDVVFSPDGTMLASGGSDGTIRLWVVAP